MLSQRESEEQHCDKISVNHVNLVKNSLRLALPYLTNRSSTKCENWCDGKDKYPNDQHCDKLLYKHCNITTKLPQAIIVSYILLTKVALKLMCGAKA